MKKVFFNFVGLFFLFFFIANLSAQEDLKHKWNVGITSSFDFFSTFEKIETSSQTGYFRYQSYPVYNFSIGLEAGFSFNKFLAIKSGFNYQVKDFFGVCYCHVCDKLAGPPVSLEIRYVEIPIYVQSHLRKKNEVKVNPFVNMGLSNSVLVGVDDLLNAQGIQKWITKINLGIGTSFNFSKKISLDLGIDFKYAFNDATYFDNDDGQKNRNKMLNTFAHFIYVL